MLYYFQLIKSFLINNKILISSVILLIKTLLVQVTNSIRKNIIKLVFPNPLEWEMASLN